jgi:hypothetical protein
MGNVIVRIEEKPESPFARTAKAIQHRIVNRRDADIVIKIRSGEIVEYTDTDIVRFRTSK